MIILIVHDDAGVRQELRQALGRAGFGPCLVAGGLSEARSWQETAGASVELVITTAGHASMVGEWRAAVGPVRALFLAEGDLGAWAGRLPGELLLPAVPLPTEAVVGWVTALSAERKVPSDVPLAAPAAAVALPPRFAPPPESAGFGAPAVAAAVAERGDQTAGGPTREVSSTAPLLGDYELLEVLSTNDETVTYRALQRSVNRVVLLERLRTAAASHPPSAQAFRSLVRAQAAVVHPQIAAVYEAQEQDGRIFYTREWVQGRSVDQLRSRRQRLPQESVLNLMQAAAEAVLWFADHGLARRALTPGDVILGPDELPRVINIAMGTASPFLDQSAEMLALFGAAQQILDPARPAPEFQEIMTRVRDVSGRGLRTWAELMPFVVEARRQLAEARPSKTRRLSTGSRPLERRQQAKRRWIQASFATVAALGGWMLFHMIPYWRAPQPRLLDEMVRIPGGSFIYQGGEMRELPTFWISKYEVSIAQYARFLEHLASSSGHRYDHPRQPATKSTHRPPAWDELLATARKGGVWRGQAVDVNCPVTDVDYWDAWAYAAWRGQRLPTEMEWEKAARSTDGRLYPWGSHPDAPSANTGADVDSGPDLGRKDGYASWAPVDAFTTTDISPYGVVGMAGNVSEWTDSTMLHPDILDQQVPVLRGGSYAARPADLQQRRPALNAGVGDPTVGFRTASDRAP